VQAGLKGETAVQILSACYSPCAPSSGLRIGTGSAVPEWPPATPALWPAEVG